VLLRRPTQDQLLIDWTATINELQSPTSQVTSPDTLSLGDVTGPLSIFLAELMSNDTVQYCCTIGTFFVMLMTGHVLHQLYAVCGIAKIYDYES